jgi:transposase
MDRYKNYSCDQMKRIPVSIERQVLSGSFEYSLLIDHELDISTFDSRYCNDDNSRPVYDPRLLLKIVIPAYSKGIISSRQMERLCRENITFMALSADSQSHFSTLADFVNRSPDVITDLCGKVVLMCYQRGPIGKQMFAIDGCRLPTNTPKEWSGTHKESCRKKQKIGRAKMKANHGVIQGRTGLTAVDSRHQVVVHAEVFGQGQGHSLIRPVIKGIRETFKSTGKLKKTKITADAGYHDRETLEYLQPKGIDGYLADTEFRSRVPRFKDYKAAKERNKRMYKERFMQFQAYEKDCDSAA